jgi:hypothetical protein
VSSSWQSPVARSSARPQFRETLYASIGFSLRDRQVVDKAWQGPEVRGHQRRVEVFLVCNDVLKILTFAAF